MHNTTRADLPRQSESPVFSEERRLNKRVRRCPKREVPCQAAQDGTLEQHRQLSHEYGKSIGDIKGYRCVKRSVRKDRKHAEISLRQIIAIRVIRVTGMGNLRHHVFVVVMRQGVPPEDDTHQEEQREEEEALPPYAFIVFCAVHHATNVRIFRKNATYPDRN